MTIAQTMAERTANLIAFNRTNEEKAATVRTNRNQWGTLYTFRDGSRAWIPQGTANVIPR